MKCVICHGQDIQEMKVNEEVRVENDIVFVPAKVSVCQTCGERYYDRKTVRFLEKAREELRKGQRPLEEVGKVLRYG